MERSPQSLRLTWKRRHLTEVCFRYLTKSGSVVGFHHWQQGPPRTQVENFIKNLRHRRRFVPAPSQSQAPVSIAYGWLFKITSPPTLQTHMHTHTCVWGGCVNLHASHSCDIGTQSRRQLSLTTTEEPRTLAGL